MTREKMQRAVLFGLKRSQGKPMEAQAEAVLNAMEIAMEMESEEKAAEPIDFSPERQHVPSGLPIPPQSITPVGPDGGGLIDTVVETAQANPAPAARITSVRRADGPVVDLPKLLEVLHSHTPPTIDITIDHPEKGLRTVRLERNVIADPIAKTARLTYKHPLFSDDMQAVVVLEADGPLPDLAGAVAEVRRRAEKLYAWRPAHIEPVAPPPPRGFSLDTVPKLNVEEAMLEEATAPKPSSVSGLKFDTFKFGQ
jgi:hypothetical protein